jgi:hypothetical protein
LFSGTLSAMACSSVLQPLVQCSVLLFVVVVIAALTVPQCEASRLLENQAAAVAADFDVVKVSEQIATPEPINVAHDVVAKVSVSIGTVPTNRASDVEVYGDVSQVVDASGGSVDRRMSNYTRRVLAGCGTGNPIDDCWRCDPNWESNRQSLADCAIGFGQNAIGGRNGEIYVVTDESDDAVTKPKYGTLRWGVIQTQPLWIIFARDMMITLKEELIMNSFKTLDGRGANVHIAGGACLTLQYISNVIVHGLHIHNCKSTGDAMVRTIAATQLFIFFSFFPNFCLSFWVDRVLGFWLTFFFFLLSLFGVCAGDKHTDPCRVQRNGRRRRSVHFRLARLVGGSQLPGQRRGRSGGCH